MGIRRYLMISGVARCNIFGVTRQNYEFHRKFPGRSQISLVRYLNYAILFDSTVFFFFCFFFYFFFSMHIYVYESLHNRGGGGERGRERERCQLWQFQRYNRVCLGKYNRARSCSIQSGITHISVYNPVLN